MAEYIERDFVLNGIDTVIVAAKGIAGDDPISIKTVSIIKNIRAFIDSVPAADVAPVVHGRWYWAEDGHCKCSVCGQYATVKRTVVKTNYCPNCGARMDGE